ncbi:hypothetical protein HOA56_02525 [archaeon]|jgi:hypothetical protein|nr:hypothetical protein [archaeon]MBT6821277.1 hypothetical protein [archaeon]
MKTETLESVVESTMNGIISRSRSKDWNLTTDEGIHLKVHPYVFAGYSTVDFSEAIDGDLDNLYLLNRARANIAKNMATFYDVPSMAFSEKNLEEHIMKLGKIRDLAMEGKLLISYLGKEIDVFKDINNDGVFRFNPELIKIYRDEGNPTFKIIGEIANEKLCELGLKNKDNVDTRDAIDFYNNGLNILDSFQNGPAKKGAKEKFDRRRKLITEYTNNPTMKVNIDFFNEVNEFVMSDSKHEGYLSRSFFNLKLAEQGDYMLMMFDAVGLNILNKLSMEESMLKLYDEYTNPKGEEPDKNKINGILMNLLRDVDEHIEDYNQMIRQKLDDRFGEENYIATVGGDETIIAIPYDNLKEKYLEAIGDIADFMLEIKEEVKKPEYIFKGQELKLRSSFVDFMSFEEKNIEMKIFRWCLLMIL